MEHCTVLVFSSVPSSFYLHRGENNIEQITSSRCNFPWKAMALHLIYYFSTKALNVLILTLNISKSDTGLHILSRKNDEVYFKKEAVIFTNFVICFPS